MAQFDIYKNENSRTAQQYPLLLEVQSDALINSTRAVYIPLVSADYLKRPDSTLNPKFEIDGDYYRLFPLDIASAPRSVVGDFVVNIQHDGDRVIGALDLLFARF